MTEPIVTPSTVALCPAESVARYAARFHAALGAEHAAASPLGAYLLLAAIAPMAKGAAREELERTLGCPIDQAAKFLAELLAKPHPAVALALALWNAPHIVNPAFGAWRNTLPTGTESGPIPSQEAIDAWARRATQGILPEFPLRLDPRTVFLLASALATSDAWEDPFDVVDAAELGPTSCFGRVRRVLQHVGSRRDGIAWTESAGLVGVSVASTESGLHVVSAIAEPGVEPQSAIAAAHEVAALACGGRTTAAHRSLFDLPLGAGHAWDITEAEVITRIPGERKEIAEVRIPAWEAALPPLDLLGSPAFGFGGAVTALLECLPPDPDGSVPQAVQATRAKFDRYGFSAASISAMGRYAGMAMRREPDSRGLERHVTIRFARPFAVAVVTESRAANSWHGVPVFSAWVTRAIEPGDRGPALHRRRRFPGVSEFEV